MFKNKIKDSYKGFELISETEIPDCSSVALYLRHKKTGLEVFHLLNDDSENLFAFAFRTPVKNSTGAAHITEHSVFCGSEKFPLKEPFTNMMNQSVNTFLNALTYSDKTVYPASSTVKEDYFNLMNVYGDAVFFPLLKKEAFLQEAHRIELDENGKPSVQGVVYNEMKGSYSSFESVANDIQLRSLFPDTNYAFDSGGDPLVIPDFTYDAFKSFHKKYYRPDNCLVFLYGNISTEEQLDFLQSHFLDRLEKCFAQPEFSDYYPDVPKEFEEIETPPLQDAPIKIVETAPSTGATGSTVTVNWLCGLTKNLSSYIEAAFMSEVLAGHDASPLSKALIDSDLGDDMAPLSGVTNETRNFTVSFGLHGVKRINEKKVYKLIFSTLEKICRNGISKADIDAALMSAEFANREVVRAGGPYSLVLLDRALNGWNYGRNPAEMLLFRDEFEKIRKNVENDSDYVVNLVKRFMLENPRVSYVTVRPSKSYLLKRAKKEKKLLEKLVKNADLNQIKKDLELLHSYQNHHETSEELACIPRLKISSLSTEFERIQTKIVKVKSFAADDVAVFVNKEETNGIGYLEVCFPLDSLSPEEYMYLPFFSYCASNVGWNGKDWTECAQDTAVYTGGIFTRLLTSQKSDTKRAKKMEEKLKDFNVVGRDWIIFTLRYLDEKLEDSLSLFAESVSSYEFNDFKRLKNLLAEFSGSLKASVVPHGNRFASRRVQCSKNHSGTVNELWNGLSQLFFLNKIAKQPVEQIKEKFVSIKNKLFKAGGILHLTADENTMNISMKKLPEFIQNAKISAVMPKVGQDENALKNLLLLPGESSFGNTENFVVDSQVGFAASVLPGTFFGQKENSADLVLAHWLSGTFLWERVRTTGGAYGAYASSANLSGLFVFSTFRDPSPEKSVKTFAECLKDASETELSKEECERIITGTYGEEIQPHSPCGKGMAGFFRTIYCIDEDDRQDKLAGLLKVSSEDIKKSAENLLKSADETINVIICNKTLKNTSVNINLPL